METKEKNEVILAYMNNSIHVNYFENWQWLMKTANRLKQESTFLSVSFTKEHLSFDIEVLFENVYEYIVWLNKNKN